MPSFAPGAAQSLYGQISDPSYGAAQFERAAAGGPQLNDFLGMTAARGGSFAQGAAQFGAARRERQGQAYDALGQFQLGKTAQQASLLDLMDRREQFDAGLAFQGRQASLARRGSFMNNLLGIGATGLGALLGGPAGAAIGKGVGGFLGNLFGGGRTAPAAQPFEGTGTVGGFGVRF